MRHVYQDLQSMLYDLMGLDPLDMSDEAYTAGIMLEL
jgi:hypothetical protein